MANHKSAIKRIRSNNAKRELNRYQHKTARTIIKNVRTAKTKAEAEPMLKIAFNAVDKLAKKNADVIVLNTLSSTTGFESNTNAVEVFFQDGQQHSFPLTDKSELGQQLLHTVLAKFQWV